MAKSSILTRLARAENSSDLSESRPDVQTLRAAGLAAVRDRAGAALARCLHTEKIADVTQAHDEMVALVGRKFHGLSPIEKSLAVTRALRWWIRPACPKCHGRGAAVIKDTTTLSDTPCPACFGSGKAMLELQGKEAEATRWVASEIDQLVESYGRRIGRKLGR